MTANDLPIKFLSSNTQDFIEVIPSTGGRIG